MGSSGWKSVEPLLRKRYLEPQNQNSVATMREGLVLSLSLAGQVLADTVLSFLHTPCLLKLEPTAGYDGSIQFILDFGGQMATGQPRAVRNGGPDALPVC